MKIKIKIVVVEMMNRKEFRNPHLGMLAKGKRGLRLEEELRALTMISWV